MNWRAQGRCGKKGLPKEKCGRDTGPNYQVPTVEIMQMQSKSFDKIDINKDGKITSKEVRAFKSKDASQQ